MPVAAPTMKPATLIPARKGEAAECLAIALVQLERVAESEAIAAAHADGAHLRTQCERLKATVRELEDVIERQRRKINNLTRSAESDKLAAENHVAERVQLGTKVEDLETETARQRQIIDSLSEQSDRLATERDLAIAKAADVESRFQEGLYILLLLLFTILVFPSPPCMEQ
ncbi:hypothetical protein C8R45DRAFT_1019087 [Mycena sanguinolenta]|nr:hypothetical protein C8R45DRAFT_1019087 [Mycena sanguinolenta]